MHNAPAVSYSVGRSSFHARLVACVAFVGAVTLFTWTGQADQWLVRHVGAWLFWLLSTVWATWCWWRTPSGVLQFAGEYWNWVGTDQTLTVTVVAQLDLQHTLLVLMRDAQSRSSWLWLEQRRKPQRWAALRRAVYAKRRDAKADGPPEVLA